MRENKFPQNYFFPSDISEILDTKLGHLINHERDWKTHKKFSWTNIWLFFRKTEIPSEIPRVCWAKAHLAHLVRKVDHGV